MHRSLVCENVFGLTSTHVGNCVCYRMRKCVNVVLVYKQYSCYAVFLHYHTKKISVLVAFKYDFVFNVKATNSKLINRKLKA